MTKFGMVCSSRNDVNSNFRTCHFLWPIFTSRWWHWNASV